MFEYHGWISLSESTREEEDDDVAYDSLVEGARQLCEQKSDGWGVAQVAPLNGRHFVMFHGCRNHKQPWVLELFSEIGARGKGCYGTLHIRDDENPEHLNGIQFFVMRRGAVSSVPELHLSPCMPVLEE